jgi:GDP-L-fucose synthase
MAQNMARAQNEVAAATVIDDADIHAWAPGTDVTIRELVETVMDVVGYTGSIEFDTTKPDGTPRKLMDVSRLAALGWRAGIVLTDGLVQSYRWFLSGHETARTRGPKGPAQ